MKRDGKNIILSNDVTVESGTNKGKSLDEILERQDSEIRELKSNVKWIYKYGGVGTGKGGGNYSTSWSIYARLGKDSIGGDTIMLPKKGSYVLVIRINNPLGGVFKVTYEYSNSRRRVTLNQDNAWTLEETIILDSNDKIRIEVLDENNEIKTVESEYITQTYTFDYKLVDDSGNVFMGENNTAYISRIKETGLKMYINYSVIDSIESFIIRYTPFGSTDEKEELVTTDLEHSGTMYLPVFDFPTQDMQENFIGTFYFKMYLVVEGNTVYYEVPLTILPGSLYLLVEPVEGRVYSEDEIEGEVDLENIYQYYKGTVSFYVTAYIGDINSGNSVECRTCIIGPGEEEEEEQDLRRLNERVTTKIVLNLSKVGWNEIKFYATFRETVTKSIFIYIKDFTSDLGWYPRNLRGEEYNSYKNIFRVGHTNSSNSGFYIVGSDNTQKPLIETLSMTINSSNEIRLKPRNLPSNAVDCLICVGIQYNSTSDSTIPILELVSMGNESTKITIFQNSIKYGTETAGKIYIGTELDDYNKNEGKNYHLLTIYRRFVSKINNISRYEFCIYIDGILEAAKFNYITTAPTYTDIILKKNNYFINTLELSYFPHSSNNDYLTDTGIVRYWYTYKEQVQGLGTQIDSKITTLLNQFEGADNSGNSGVYLDDSRVAVRSMDTLNGIVQNSKVPVMLISYDESSVLQGQSGFLAWSENTSYSDNSTPDPKRVSVMWSPGSTDPSDPAPALSEVKYQGSYGDPPANFQLSIQGSSTKAYTSKNYMLTLNWEGEVHNQGVPLFSPNFKRDDPTTFLPERAFTLKADVVDSGHSNNTCMGSFINSVTKPFSATSGNSTQKYKDYVRNCLEGFPFLMFVRIDNPGGDSTAESKIYYLGIYNFNLGRNSYFNLGYSDVSELPDPEILTQNQSGGFHFCKVNSGVYGLKPGFISAEVAYNSNYFDFSQYSPSILFGGGDNDDTFMFDDIYTSDPEDVAQDFIAGFVKATTRAGAFVFTKVGKQFGAHDQGYDVVNQVPEYNPQYRKVVRNEIEYEVDPTLTSEIQNNDPGTRLSDLLLYVDASEEEPESAYFSVDYRSLIEYYTICMAFGMVDSVQKNLTIKTWGNRKFYFAFYDMDTCLGIDNDGKNSTYYAFSDFWEQGISSDTGIQDTYRLDGQVNVLRDYFLKSEGIIGYDTPSSYAFAVAKYFQSVTPPKYRYMESPQTLWAKWRNNTLSGNEYGYLSSADKFIDRFYLGYMKNVNELMFNYNYRQKYLRYSDGISYRKDDYSMFHGRRTEYIRDWLSGRFHIMDAYFNMSQANIKLQPDAQFEYFEPKPEIVDGLNEDIFVIRDIFSSGNSSLNGNLLFTVQAPDFSPLLIKRGDVVSRYLLPSSSRKYEIYFENPGTNKITLGGSALWTYLDSINSFIQKEMVISSTRLKNIVGTQGLVETWKLTLPALQNISLTSPNYSGLLTFDASTSDDYPNLDTIDISNGNIGLTVINESIREVVANDVGLTSNTPPDLVITECRKLENVQVNRCRFTKLEIAPVWTKNITLSGNRISEVTLSCSANDPSTLSISDEALEILEVTNFSSITIGDCPKLREVYIFGNNLTNFSISRAVDAPELEKLSISDISNLNTLSLSGCMKFKTLSLNGDPSNIKTLRLDGTRVSTITYDSDHSSYNNPGILDLTPMSSLNIFAIEDNPVVTVIKLRNDPDHPIKSTISGCSELTRVYGHIKITGSSALSHLPKFRLLPSTWNGETISTTNKTPLQILANIDIVNPEEVALDANNNPIKSPEVLHNEICTAFDTILDNLRNSLAYTFEYTNNSNTVKKSWFTCVKNSNNTINIANPGVNTNITFGNTENTGDGKIGKVLSGICYSTPVSQFEIYYLLNAFAISAARATSTVDNQSLSSSFTGSSTDRFSYSSGKYPNRYMFYGCSSITSLGKDSISTGSNSSTKLVAPSHDSNGNILCDNGLFSPLINLGSDTSTTAVGLFIGASQVYLSRFLFRRKNNVSYPITSFRDFRTSVICDEVDTKTKAEVDDSVNVAKYGNLTGFFDNIKSNSLITIRSSFSPEYLNFNTLEIPSTKRVSSVVNSFNPTNGYGVLNLSNIFKYKTSLTSIVNSFKVEKASQSYHDAIESISGVASINSEGRVLFPLKDGMFTGFTNLSYIGARNVSGDVYNEFGTTIIEANTDSAKAGTASITFGFSGNGLLKYIDQSTFPYKIFNDLNSKLIICSGFMSELNSYGNNFGSLEEDIFNFPGTLFCSNNTGNGDPSNINLEDVSGFLKNCKVKYRLTSEGFSKCTKLQNVSEIFYGSVANDNKCSRLIGNIPTKLFYHGIAQAGRDRIVYGCNDIDGINPEDCWEHEEYKIVIPGKPVYNRKIRYAYKAFYGCADIDPYVYEIPSTFGRKNPQEEIINSTGNSIIIDNLQEEYINEKYTYWRYYTTDNTSWKDGDTKPLDISSVFDGESDNIPNEIKELAICEEDFNTLMVVGSDDTDIGIFSETHNKKQSNTTHFICAPDLLSYLDNNSSTNIQYLFCYCGCSYNQSFSLFTKAMTGRICSYFLKPISNISLLSGIFRWCSGLSSVKFLDVDPENNNSIQDESTYLIPPKFFSYATKVDTLAGAFTGVYFESNPSLNVFNSLTTSRLDIRGIFSWCGYVDAPLISGIFGNNKFSAISGAFSAYPISIGNFSSSGGGTGVVRTGVIPRRGSSNGARFNNNFTGSIASILRSTYYVYYGHGRDYATEIAINTNDTIYSNFTN